MKLSPRMIQAMEILQLPMMALQERIETEMESNPVLELKENHDDMPDEPVLEDYGDRGETDMVVDDGGNVDDFSRLDEMTSEYGSDFANSDAPMQSRKSVNSDEPDRKLEAMANTAAPEGSLHEYLQSQWMFIDAPEPIKQAGDLIIEYIEPDGRLGVSLDELPAKAIQSTDQAPVTIESLRTALSLVQTLEPTGIGARDLKECLLLQLSTAESAGADVTLEKQLVTNFLREIEMNRLPGIAKRLGKTVEEIKAGIENIQRLNPRPGLLIGSRDVPVISPDVIVTINDNDQVVVTMADANMPNLGVDDYYAHAARDKNTEKSAKQFLKKNIRSAEWLISAIAQRRHTIRRVTEEVFAYQRDFLENGIEALKPLPMADVADKVGVHVATVSRAVADKYVQTPQGIFPLRMFFSGGTKTADGDDVSWDAVKVKLQEIVDNEDKANPLNDDQLAEALKENGIDIARRTVAKYRGILDIAPARKRRTY